MMSRTEGKSYIKAISKFQLVLLAGLYKQALSGATSAAPRTTQTGQRRGGTVGTEESTDDEITDS